MKKNLDSIKVVENWKEIFRTFYDDNEAGGSSRWLLSPTTVKTLVGGFIEQARKEGYESGIDFQAKVTKVVVEAERDKVMNLIERIKCWNNCIHHNKPNENCPECCERKAHNLALSDLQSKLKEL